MYCIYLKRYPSIVQSLKDNGDFQDFKSDGYYEQTPFPRIKYPSLAFNSNEKCIEYPHDQQCYVDSNISLIH
jgi:hypothetical protein